MTVENKGSGKQTLMAGSIVVLVVALAASLVSLVKINTVEKKLVHTPPVVVIDFVSLVDGYGDDLTPSELEERMLKTRDSVSALRDAGYLVLDAANVVAAPEELLLTESEL